MDMPGTKVSFPFERNFSTENSTVGFPTLTQTFLRILNNCLFFLLSKVDSKQRISVRNLRIREDTAKYLRNLDPNSAYYDPKTRSMRDNPYKNTGKGPDEVDFAGTFSSLVLLLFLLLLD